MPQGTSWNKVQTDQIRQGKIRSRRSSDTNSKGKHAALNCEKCHVKEKITAKDVQHLSDSRKSRTFLGLGTQCLSCHKDEHRGQFKAECVQCHTMNGWKPASKFSHDNAKFKLEGSHTKVDVRSVIRKLLRMER